MSDWNVHECTEQHSAVIRCPFTLHVSPSMFVTRNDNTKLFWRLVSSWKTCWQKLYLLFVVTLDLTNWCKTFFYIYSSCVWISGQSQITQDCHLRVSVCTESTQESCEITANWSACLFLWNQNSNMDTIFFAQMSNDGEYRPLINLFVQKVGQMCDSWSCNSATSYIRS